MAAATAALPLSQRYREAVFNSVFPATHFTTPTPETTPNIGVLHSEGQSFGGPQTPFPTISDAVQQGRAWSAATRFLTNNGGLSGSPSRIPIRLETVSSFASLLTSDNATSELLDWYINDVGIHYRQHVRPQLSDWQQPIPVNKALSLLQRTANLLQEAQVHYLSRLRVLLDHASLPANNPALEIFTSRTRQNIQALFRQSIPLQRFEKTLASVIYHQIEAELPYCPDPVEVCMSGCQCRFDANSLPIEQLYEIGFGAVIGEKALAQAADRLIAGPIIRMHHFLVDWSDNKRGVPFKMMCFIRYCFKPLLERLMEQLIGHPTFHLIPDEWIALEQSVMASLGWQRTLSLFDYVQAWPRSRNALYDIRDSLGTPRGDRALVCHSFIDQMRKRLLHAGASTVEVLSMYSNLIHAFREIDPRGVMLEKVAVPIRDYLRSRDDTVSIIAASFLTEVDKDGNVKDVDPEKVCADIAVEVSRSTLVSNRPGKALTFNDMSWEPDPIDAGPEYRNSKSEDVVAYILGLFDQEEFIKEVTAVLAQQLLQSTDYEYVKETRLVELFKSRLDASKLQAAEVMLKDMRDSVSLNKRINATQQEVVDVEPPTPAEIRAAMPEEGITSGELYKRFQHRIKHPQFVAMLKVVANKRHDLYYPKRTRIPADVAAKSSASESMASRSTSGHLHVNTQILSSFFWPQMRSDEFLLPQTLLNMEKAYTERFAALGNHRILQYRHALGRVTVELELEDRQIRETDVPTWRASVIDTFAQAQGETLDVEQLAERLQMQEELVNDALAFWTAKRVLYAAGPGKYAVLERLDMDVKMAADLEPQQQPSAAAISAVMSQDSLLRESAPMFQTFIANMLRNGGAKAVGGMMGITNMLKMVLPTFTYGEDETVWLLEEMERRHEVARNGDMWSVAG